MFGCETDDPKSNIHSLKKKTTVIETLDIQFVLQHKGFTNKKAIYTRL